MPGSKPVLRKPCGSFAEYRRNAERLSDSRDLVVTIACPVQQARRPIGQAADPVPPFGNPI
jgi:hypothetical protein